MKNKILLLVLPMFLTTAFADTSTPPVDPNAAAKISVDAMKEKYWEKTTDVELRVVQNRRYTQYKKFDLQFFGGTISTDPFLAVKNIGGSIGYHFNDYFALRVLGFKDIVGNSSATTVLEEQNSQTPNTNEPKYFIGGEADFVPLYGKFSLLGNAIVYVDTHLDFGMGTTSTETGHDATPFAGLGEQFYLNRFSSLYIDYRLMYYRETLGEKGTGAGLPALGTPIGNRASWNDVITVGISVFGSI
jgi:outer membrane beta-barrel protein